MIPILAALLTGVTCLLTARIFRSGAWAVWSAAAMAALLAMILPELHGPGMSGAERLATDVSRAATAALGSTVLGTIVILGSWVHGRTEG